ncbi:MAG: FAD-binding protein [Planctomycetota bacterium]
MNAPLRPESIAEIVEAVRAARADRARLVPVGAGTALTVLRPDAEGARTLDLAGLARGATDGVVEYARGDGTITLHAGARVGDVARAVRAGGHRLTPLLPARDEAATIGGVLGAGASGPDRVALGPLRHHVLGLTFVDGTGRVARSGGRLVKNVTGFDLHRLLVGAHGTLGAVLEVSLRLFPAPEEEVLYALETDGARSAATIALELFGARQPLPRYLFVRGPRVFAGLAGRRAQVERDARALVDRGLRRVEQGEDAAARAAADGSTPPGPVWSFGVRPSRCSSLMDALADAGASLVDALVEPGLARVVLRADALPDGSAVDLAAVRATGARVLSAPPEVRVGGASTAPLFERRLRAAFDPDGVFGVPALDASASGEMSAGSAPR